MLVVKLKKFLRSRFRELPQGKRGVVLVACSGGPDSKALLYLFLRIRKFFNFTVEVAHIDHGWRAHSGEVAQALRREVESMGVRIHMTKLEGIRHQESEAREARYRFLTQTARDLEADAVALGHQMEDQAETVLKRILEGAYLPFCGGMKEVSVLNGLPLWRPLLSVSKRSLIQWLDREGVTYDCDATNLNPRFLRGRMRGVMFPYLERIFGKNVVNNLASLGMRVQSWEQYLKRHIEPLEEIRDVRSLNQSEDAILEYFLKAWARREGVSLSSQHIERLMGAIRAEQSEYCIITREGKLCIEGGVVAFKRKALYTEGAGP